MLSVILLSEGSEHAAVATLSALVPGAAAGVIREVLLVDLARSEVIGRVADIAGCSYLPSQGSRAEALAGAAARARAPWLMFLPAGAVPDPGWIDETGQFVQSVASSGVPRAGILKPARSPFAPVGWRDWLISVTRRLGQPTEQGLLIAREHYEQLGGHRGEGRSPERRLLRRLGRSSRIRLRSRIVLA